MSKILKAQWIDRYLKKHQGPEKARWWSEENTFFELENESCRDLVLSVKLQLRKPPVQNLCFLPPKVVLSWSSSTIEDHLPLKVICYQKSSSIKGCLPSTVIFNLRSSSMQGRHTIKGYLPSKVVFYERSSSIEGPLQLKLIFHWRLSSIDRCYNKSLHNHFETSHPCSLLWQSQASIGDPSIPVRY